jgi:hypothetical protein
MPKSSREDIALFAIRYYSFNKILEDRSQNTEYSRQKAASAHRIQKTEDRIKKKKQIELIRQLLSPPLAGGDKGEGETRNLMKS